MSQEINVVGRWIKLDAQKRQFQLNVPGLLKVLAENLYSNRKVAIRELIQNAHDSIMRRVMAAGGNIAFKPRIQIRTNPAKGILTIEDNGDGMDDADIIQYLTTIGNSYTREVGSTLEFLQPERASVLIGQFGMGFLSAFLIASEVKLYTRKADGQGWYWYCDASEFYEMKSSDYAPVGTLIELTLKPEAETLLNSVELSGAIRRYADFLPLPIFLNTQTEPVNLMTPPWEADDSSGAIAAYLQRAFQQSDALHAFTLHDQVIDLGHDSLTVPLRGVMFIPPSSVVSVREYGDVMIYIRRMFITDQERDLLPSWARFFRGVIDCAMLQPTASRESLHQEESFMAVRQALETQLLTELRRVAYEQPHVWRRIVLAHTDLVLGWVTVNDEFFDQVADLLPVQTSRGAMLLKDYLARTENTFYYVTQQIGSLQDQLLGEGFEVPVIDASWFAVRPFLEKYASRLPVPPRLVQMDGDAKRLMQAVNDPRYDGLVMFFRKQGIPAKIAAYKPHGVPGLMLYPRNADALIEARRALDSEELSDPFTDIISDYLSQQSDDEDSQPTGVLYLNASCPLVRQLIEPTSAPHRETVLTLIHQIAKLFAGRTLTPHAAAHAFNGVTHSILEMINHG